jgi:serine/threonine-protein kinase
VEEEEKPLTESEDKLLAELARAPDVTPHTALLGTRLGRYQIDSLVGRGGMGVVFRAHDTVLDRAVALKLVPSEMLADEERRERFVREARSAAATTHANIAAVYDVGEIDGQVFIAMELVEGETLRARIRREPLTTEEAIIVARGIVRGLTKAHEKGIVHRDLKPDNVMIGEALHPKLLDFGLAKLREEGVVSGASQAGVERGREGTLTYDGRVLGTPSYMSPEQAKGKEVDARTDLFSFGIVFYELLAGERPFRGDSAIEILSAVTRDPPPPLPKSIRHDVAAIVAHCLEKDPNKRYASAKDLLADLESLNTSMPSGIRSTARANPPAPGDSKRHLWIIGAATVLGLAAIASTRVKTAHAPVTASSATPTRGRAVTDHPRPRSNNPAALAAYGSALQNFRDGSIAFASHELGRAAMLDPELAAAHLRALLIGTVKLDSKAREHYAAASQHRAALDERDTALLQASEEMIREHPDFNAMARAMTAVAQRYPDDAEVAWVLGTMLEAAGRTEDAKKAARRARELDPKFAAALWFEASMLEEDHQNEAIALLDECLRISPSAASCLRIRSVIRSTLGDCSGFESDARRMTEVEPRGPRAYEFLAAALAARGAPIDSVRAALEKRASLGVAGTGDSPAEMRAQSELWPALLAGDFVAAEDAARALDKIVDGDASELSHVVPALTLIDIYEERGEPERALALAETFVRRLPAWTANAPGGVRAKLIAMQRRAGKIDDARVRTERDALIKEGMEADHNPDPRKAIWFWLDIEAQYAASAEDAKNLMKRLPPLGDGGLPPPRGFDLWPRGKVELLSGDPRAASASLGTALSTCTLMPMTDGALMRLPFTWMEAQILMGDALEDRDRACEAYGRVLDRWKDAKPRSVSVEKARTRARARGCKG